jgi:hypothetical protein
MRSVPTFAFLWPLCGVWLAGALACEGEDSSPAAAAQGPIACDQDSPCDDTNPCTLDRCGEDGFCSYEALPDQAVDPVPGDCRRTVCRRGSRFEEPDLGDVDDDGEDCTLDTCDANSQPVHLAKIEEHPCIVGSRDGACHAGRCAVSCTPSSPSEGCDDGNACTTESCAPCSGGSCVTGGWCDYAKLNGIPTPGAAVVEGDCQESRCVDGVETAVALPDDFTDDEDPCTEDGCDGTESVHRPREPGEACTESGALVCDNHHRCLPPCAVDGSCALAILANYWGGTFTVDIDVDQPNLVIGLSSYHSMQVTISGPYASNVAAVHYVGYDEASTTAVEGVSAELVSIDRVQGLADYGCSSYVYCDPLLEISQYFLERYGGTLSRERCEHDEFTGTMPLGALGGCTP